MKSFSQFVDEEILKGEDGKPTRFLHGTTKDFDQFKPGKYKRTMQLGFGIHFTEDPKLANHYAGDIYGPRWAAEKGGHVKMVNLDVKKALDTTKIYKTTDLEYRFAQELHQRTGRPLFVSDNQFVINLDVTGPARAERLLRKYGYDAVIYNAKVGRRTWQGGKIGFQTDIQAKSILVLDPSQVKPMFATE